MAFSPAALSIARLALRTLACAAFAAGLMVPARSNTRAGEPLAVDLKLVLAVDASDSIDESEWRLQLSGIAEAFLSRQLQKAIEALPHRRIGVALLVWADPLGIHDTTGWRLIDSAAAASAFSSEIRGFPRRAHGGTGIGAGVAAAVKLLGEGPYDSTRQVIDVSGDGSEPPPIRSGTILMSTARMMAREAGITINGLAITTEQPWLEDWYRTYVITGSRAFVMSVRDFEDFDRTFLEKLLRELEPDVARLMGKEPVSLR